jgi:hypothetical protein
VDGTKINFEVQLKNRYNMNRRSLFYWAREYAQALAGLQRNLNLRILPPPVELLVACLDLFRVFWAEYEKDSNICCFSRESY